MINPLRDVYQVLISSRLFLACEGMSFFAVFLYLVYKIPGVLPKLAIVASISFFGMIRIRRRTLDELARETPNLRMNCFAIVTLIVGLFTWFSIPSESFPETPLTFIIGPNISRL